MGVIIFILLLALVVECFLEQRERDQKDKAKGRKVYDINNLG
jgi:hypothetical protein